MSDYLPILLGDSIFRRLLERHRSLFHPLSSRFCVGGQTVQELFESVRDSRSVLKGRKVVVLIGTNDIVSGLSAQLLCKALRDLIRYLKRQGCSVSVCEILPIPKLGTIVSPRINEVNRYLWSFEPSGVKIIHTVDQFSKDLSIYVSLFEKFIVKGKRKRVDLVHPTADGLEILLICLEI